MIVDNTRNVERIKNNKKYEFYDDCGIWVSQKGNTTKSHYYIDGDNLVYCEIKQRQYCVKKRCKGKISWVPLEPQPERVVVLSKYHATLKENPKFKKHVTFIYDSPDVTLSNVALYEYQGEQPNTDSFVRTYPKTMDKIKENITHKKPKEIYAELRIDDSMNFARDFRVIKNLKYQQKQKEKIARSNRVNVADEILEVLGMVNEHPFVQTIIHNKDQVPNIICYTNKQILDLKHFVKNAPHEQIKIDRTFNLGNYYVTTIVYKNQRVVRKQQKGENAEHPIFWDQLCYTKTPHTKHMSPFWNTLKRN